MAKEVPIINKVEVVKEVPVLKEILRIVEVPIEITIETDKIVEKEIPLKITK